jgi:hypothetical protein
VRHSMLRALAEGRAWCPAHEDPVVTGAVARAVAGHRDVLGHEVREGDPAGHGVLAIVLRMRPGMTREQASAAAEDVGAEFAAESDARTRIDGIVLVLH